MKRLFFIVLISLVFSTSLFSQSKLNAFLTPSDSLNKQRRNTVIIAETALVTTTLLGLNQLWYSDFERSSFRTVNDSDEWLQVDKAGHMFSSYQLGRFGASSLKWAGVSKKNQLIYGSTLGLGFLTAVEIMDGFSEEWGFSWSDMAANAAGTGLYVGQDLIWNEQRILLKYSFSRSSFAPERPEILGNGLTEEFLKDYNGQTYWLSANIESFFKTDKIPKWLNIAFGYGADGMITGNTDNSLFPDQNPIRQYYLSLDLDLSRIKTKSHVLKTIFDILNVLKVPFPTLEFNSNGSVKMHYLYF